MSQGPPGWKPATLILQVELFDAETGKNRRQVVHLTTEQLGIKDGHIIAACAVIQWDHTLPHDATVSGEGFPESLLRKGTRLTYTTPQATVPLDPDDADLHHIANQAAQEAT